MDLNFVIDELSILDTRARLYGENDTLHQLFGEACAYFGIKAVYKVFNKENYPHLWEIFNKDI